MKFYTVRVEPTGSVNRDWKVSYDKTSTLKREETQTVPNAQGFYHYPEALPDDVALKLLVGRMIQVHHEEILNLMASKRALENLIKD